MQNAMEPIPSEIFLKKLEKRVSVYDARVILNSALVQSGLKDDAEFKLNAEDAKNLCLQLIKKGGPAFQVGTEVYKEHLQ